MTDTSAHIRQEIALDQQVALHTAAARPAEEVDTSYGTETIEKFLHSSYDQFASAASIPNHLPLLAERFARQRRRALARVEGHHRDGRPVVLFLCTHRDEIDRRVRRLLDELNVPATR
ncbi:three-helix bundle dimerization domain-containing protein [Micromonospora chersina]|uniref:three-helix bundle dimerization domain-containing protein n=1 Tax=Micromonospora chersina TaxID=47854 RepID=UPI0033D689C8